MNDIASIVERATAAAAEARSSAASGAPAHGDARAKLAQLATEFESTLLVQMLRDMRKSGAWGDEEDEKDGLGADAFFDTLDVELANHLSKAQGFGLATQLSGALERLQSGTTPAAPAGMSTLSTGRPAVAPLLTPPTPSVSEAPVDDDGARAGRPSPPMTGAVTSGFGWRQDPFTGRTKFHRGVDLRAAYGQEVPSADAGRVVFSGEQRGYGTTVVLEHEDGTRTRYAHLSAALVAKGDDVGAGFAIGRAGRSGRATGTHVHFEVTTADGRALAPADWVVTGRSAGTRRGIGEALD